MNYKIIRFTTCGFYHQIYNEFCNQVNPQWENQSYEEISSRWFQQFYVYGDSFSHYSKKLGNLAYDFIADNFILQKKWAKENNIYFDDQHWHHDIVLAQINFYKPDIIYLQDIGTISPELRKRLKIIFSFIKKIIIFRGYPGGALTYFQDFCDADIIFVGGTTLQKKFNLLSKKTIKLYHAFDARVLNYISISNQQKYLEASFCGIAGGRTDGHAMRRNFLINCIKKSNVKVFSEDLFNLNKEKIYHKIKRKIFNKKYKNLLGKSVFGIQYFETLANSKISLNIHSDVSLKEAENMRMFHATGVGSCLMTNSAENLNEIFEADKEVITFDSFQEFQEKLTFLISNPKVIYSISQAGQKRTLKDHTWENRAKIIHEIISKEL